MEFKTPAQQAIWEKLGPLMKELFGEMAVAREDRPTFGVRSGSAWVQTWVSAWGDDDATITTRAWLTTGTELTVDLARYLLNANDDMRFGAFGVDKDGDTFFEHTILGSTLTKEELKASVLAVAGKGGGKDFLTRMARVEEEYAAYLATLPLPWQERCIAACFGGGGRFPMLPRHGRAHRGRPRRHAAGRPRSRQRGQSARGGPPAGRRMDAGARHRSQLA